MEGAAAVNSPQPSSATAQKWQQRSNESLMCYFYSVKQKIQINEGVFLKISESVHRCCSSGTIGKSNLPTWGPEGKKRQKKLKNFTAKNRCHLEIWSSVIWGFSSGEKFLRQKVLLVCKKPNYYVPLENNHFQQKSYVYWNEFLDTKT